ncbi:hypothetical protein [Longimicrobium sp.]|uniref:hypothetical protein n=1 Tax=Longimicrobium sp. TaxID=2029185 RepID=UPI002E34A1ED|nr:hypothetical protein [Longimicrobium sp.]HEX6038889.1 hypothetical protein [Longimicrobium sp.]
MSNQGRMDAEADAAQLRIAWRDTWGTEGRIFDATYAMDWPQGPDCRAAKHHATISARAVFIAVPGLRDDEPGEREGE